MHKTLAAAVALFTTTLFAQETTFKTNGPDDFRQGRHAFIHAIVVQSPTQKTDSNGALYIDNGKIVGVFPNSAKVDGSYIVHDCGGKYIYPSFIDLYSDYGIGTPRANRDEEGIQYETNIKGAYGWNQAIRSDFDAYRNFQINDNAAAEYRKLGFGAVLTHRRDGIARGTGALVLLGNEKENRLVLKPQAGAFYSFKKGSSTQEYPSSLMGSIALIRQTYLDAQWYKNTTPAQREKEMANISLESWNAAQQLPQIFESESWLNTLRAQKIADEFGVHYLYKAGGNEYQRSKELAALKARFILPLNFPKPYDVEDPYRALWVSYEEMAHWEKAPTNPAALKKEGVEFCFTAADLEKRDDFFKNLRMAVKYGLSPEDALAALTVNPAKFIAAQDQLGTLEKGKAANFFICSKNIFDEKCVIYENWVNGKYYEITKPELKGIAGEYRLELRGGNTYDLKVTGEPSALKAVIGKDSSKTDVKLTYDETGVVILFTPDKRQPQQRLQLTGTVSVSEKDWTGMTLYADGSTGFWKAVYIKEVPADTVKPAKKDTVDFSKMGKLLYPFSGYGNEQLPVVQNVWFRNATVWTNEKEGVLKDADVIIRNGKISAVGTKLNCAECVVVDATGKHITSGIIDEHNHIAISDGVNEGTKSSSAEVRIGDVVMSEDVNIYRQLAGGVVAAQLLHGSANPIGGQSALVKFRWGLLPEQMKIAGADGFIKFALGENVKQTNWGDKFRVRYPQSRMGVEQTYYNYFTKALEYEQALAAKKPVRKDLELDALLEIIRKKRFITCHSYVQSEINMLMHVADTFGFKVNTFTHILEGYKVADKMKAHGVNASTFADWWAYKYEVIDAIPQNAGILNKMGITTAINSDDAEMARRLNQEAAKSVKYTNMSEEDAWKMVTLNPAKMLHLDAHMGSLKAGKDADVVVWSDHPLSIYARVEQTYVDGICYYDSKADEAKRKLLNSERARLIQKMLDEKKGGAPTQEPVKKDNRAYSCGENEQ
ncbi:MAG: amidohydrolase family protein [Chitinophagales bacterium]